MTPGRYRPTLSPEQRAARVARLRRWAQRYRDRAETLASRREVCDLLLAAETMERDADACEGEA